MKKINNKGFMFVETLIVATFLVTTLLFIYVQFNKITNTYDTSFKYNTVDGLYMTKNIIKYVSNDGIDKLKLDITQDGVEFIDITNCSSTYFNNSNYCNVLIDYSNVKTILFTNENLDSLKTSDPALNQTLIDFINHINYEKTDGYRIIVEFNNNTFASLKI